MALIRGSRGIVYIVHQFTPKFVEAGLFNPSAEDREMLGVVTALNRQIHELAPVLNSPTVENGAHGESSDEAVPIEIMVKRHGGATYVFAAAVRRGRTRGAFHVAGLPARATAEVLGEERTLDVTDGRFEDDFGVWDVHLYRITPAG
ncbi:unnamed protein product [marine sediment metagenome]|uniref:Uncharacterized protein n=1 Tax=marine sediment metagenome TaxID=412755 RepID=X0W083_9ZZZZ